MELITCRVRREGGKKSFNKPKGQFLEEKLASKKLVQYEKVVDVQCTCRVCVHDRTAPFLAAKVTLRM